MGNFYKIGFQSKLPIKEGDKVVVFICGNFSEINDRNNIYIYLQKR